MNKTGFITTYILIFGTVFLIMFSGLLGLILSQMKIEKKDIAYENALHIAEAGLNRYLWYITKKSQEIRDGVEIGCPPSECQDCEPCEYEYIFPGLGVVGKYKLEIEEKRCCGVTSLIVATSTGWTTDFSNTKRKIKIKYVRPSVANYSYILNNPVWAGSDREIQGPYHSNGGIRMDGINNSLVSSPLEEWTCTQSFGCSSCPSNCWTEGYNCVCNGVFTTANGNENLFRYGPEKVSPFDFGAITMDLANIKEKTKNDGKGKYIGPSGEKGYHVILKENGIEVRKITGLNKVGGVYGIHNYETVYIGNEYSLIKNEDSGIFYPYSDFGDCRLIYIEDDVWIQGVVKGKITLISADLDISTPKTETNVWLKNDITYTTKDGSDALLLTAQNNNLITPDSPSDMTLDGVYIAQYGNFGRNYYSPYSYPAYAKKNQLQIYGSIVSNGRVGTSWSSGGVWVSGYSDRKNIFNPDMTINPPPFLPTISSDFDLMEWEEIK
ncbi:MAG: hypothetical protein U9P88_01110 [Patescibacteria group bacterium]|nr:hypothetical protein [Patescibacteria group bacterium]